MMQGYLQKRHTPLSPPSMAKIYCVLRGTLMLDYNSDTEAGLSMSPKLAVEIIAVADWHGKGRASLYPNAFMITSRSGSTFFLSATTAQEKEDWKLAISLALEAHNENKSIGPFKPTSMVQPRPDKGQVPINAICPISKLTISHNASAIGLMGAGGGMHATSAAALSVAITNPAICWACGRGFSSPEMVKQLAILTAVGEEKEEETCKDCKLAQSVVFWYKFMNNVNLTVIHENDSIVVDEFESYYYAFLSFKKFNPDVEHNYNRFKLAGDLKSDQFRAIYDKAVDKSWEMQINEANRIRNDLDGLDIDVQTIISILFSPSTTNRGGRLAYMEIILKLLSLADDRPDLVDFYWPQLIQAHFIECGNLTTGGPLTSKAAFVRLDLLQQALLAISKRYPPLAAKLAWALISTVQDYDYMLTAKGQEKGGSDVSELQLAGTLALLIQLELIVTGEVSCVADFPNCKLLAEILVPARIQQQELSLELSALMLARGRIQEMFRLNEKKYRLKIAPRPSNTLIFNAFLAGGGSKASALKGFRESTRRKEEDKVEKYANGDGSRLSCMLMFSSQGLARGHVEQEAASCDDDDDSKAKGKGGDKSGKIEAKEKNTGGDSKEVFGKLIDKTKKSTLSNGGRVKDSDDEFSSSEELEKEKGDEEVVDNKVGINNGGDDRKRGKGSTSDDSGQEDNEKKNRGSWTWTGLASQLDFVYSLTTVVDDLRFVDRPLRLARFKSEVKRHVLPESSGTSGPLEPEKGPSGDADKATTVVKRVLGWDVASLAGSPIYRICEVYIDECRVFRTKARAPTLLVCRVRRDDSSSVTNPLLSSSPTSSSSMNILNVNTTKTSNASGDSVSSSNSDDNTSSSNSNSNSNSRKASSALSPINKFEVGATIDLQRGRLLENMTDNLTKANSKRTNMSKSTSNPNLSSPVSSPNNHTPSKLRPPSESSSSSTPSSPSSSPSTPQANNPKRRLSLSSLFNKNRQSTETVLLSKPNFGAFSISLNDGLKSAVKQPSSDAESLTSTSMSYRSDDASTHNLFASYLAEDDADDCMEAPIYDENASPEAEGHLVQVVSDLNTTGLQQEKKPLSTKLVPVKWLNVTKRVLLISQELLQNGQIDISEYNKLIEADAIYRKTWNIDADMDASRLISTAFGESWSDKKMRLISASDSNDVAANDNNDNNDVVDDEGDTRHLCPRFDLVSFIVKSNDDLRQEVCCLQLMQLCKDIFVEYGLARRNNGIAHPNNNSGDSIGDMGSNSSNSSNSNSSYMHDDDVEELLWIRPYKIVSTGRTTGLVEVIPNASSLDALKKLGGYTNLKDFYTVTFGSSSEKLASSKRNLASSLAAYSLFCYIFQIKDRHNGNIMLDRDGHVLHIDFGFILSIAPGGSFSQETAPFKLTEEFVDALDGPESPYFDLFVKAFTLGFLALRSHHSAILSILEIIRLQSPFPCFSNRDSSRVVAELSDRFRTELDEAAAIKHCLQLISSSYGSSGTKSIGELIKIFRKKSYKILG